MAFIGCGLIWGSTFLVIRVGNDAVPALWACSLRFALAAVILNAILFASGQRWPRGPALKAAALYGLFEFGISMPLLYWGEKVAPSGLAAVVYAICPVVAMLTARALHMETIDPRRLIAAIVAFVGVAVIFWRELVSGGSPLGLLCIFLAACSAPIAGLLLQRAPKQNAIGANAVGVVVGLPICVLASIVLGEQQAIPSTMREIFPIVYLAVAGSVGAFVLFAWLIQHWRATTVAFLGVIVPVIAVIAGALVRQEALAAGSLVGAVVVIVGVALALVSEKHLDRFHNLNGVEPNVSPYADKLED
jgi:drug/metabolite transporter (DMT)-like permease